jgi:hypothetical protein
MVGLMETLASRRSRSMVREQLQVLLHRRRRGPGVGDLLAEHVHRRHGALGVELADGAHRVGHLLPGHVPPGHLTDDELGHEGHAVSYQLVEQGHRALLGSGACATAAQ